MKRRIKFLTRGAIAVLLIIPGSISIPLFALLPKKIAIPAFICGGFVGVWLVVKRQSRHALINLNLHPLSPPDTSG